MFAASNKSTIILEIGFGVMHRQESETGKWVARWRAITKPRNKVAEAKARTATVRCIRKERWTRVDIDWITQLDATEIPPLRNQKR